MLKGIALKLTLAVFLAMALAGCGGGTWKPPANAPVGADTKTWGVPAKKAPVGAEESKK